MGEGGGQILRSSLALSLATGTPFHLRNIRAARRKPGLLQQHLTAVDAAAKVGGARAEGAALGSRRLIFTPERVKPGEFRFAVGTAGSATLVLQAVLPPLLTASGPSNLILEGGTHNPFAPPFDFMEMAFLPLIGRMGPGVVAGLERPGFYPAGGGRFRVQVKPAETLAHLDLLDRGEILNIRARALLSGLRENIGRRELNRVKGKLSLDRECLEVVEVENPKGPGNALIIEMESEAVTEVATGFGKKGVPAERVADKAVKEAKRYLAAGVPVGEHLADQLLVPMALAGGGAFRTMSPTQHTRTNIDVVKMFLDVEIDVIQEGDAFRVVISGSSR